MKRSFILCLLALGLVARGASADDWGNTLRGGLVGAALGAIVGHNTDLTTEFAVPAFAAVGALVGYGYDHRSSDPYAYGNGYTSDPGYYRNGYYNPRARYTSYPYRPRYANNHRRQDKPAKLKNPSPAELAPKHDLTPGVELVTVPLTLPSGTTFNLRLLKLPDHYVGPQGETYADLPTPETLAARYLPK